MGADVWVMRADREQANSEKVRQKVEADLERVKRVAKEIRAMTAIYRERLDGRRGQ